MQFILEGILAGLGLAILLGPIFIALTQTSIEKGLKAGLTVGTGIWLSDLLIIVFSFLFVQTLNSIISADGFKFYLGTIGGAVLMLFGIGSFFSKIDLENKNTKHSVKNYMGFFLKGFIVNTVNPFTFIFWIGMISTYVIGRQCTTNESILFLSSIFATIIFTDGLKVIVAKMLRSKLKERQIKIFSRVAGIGLFSFGLFLIYQVI